MIDKKPPRFSKASTPSDSFDDDLDDVPDLAEPDDVPVDEIDTDAEVAAMVAAQKRRANLVTVGLGAVVVAILLVVVYPRFKHFFVTDQPVVATTIATPVPEAARKNYFSGSDAAVSTTSSGTTPEAPSLPEPPVDDSVASATGASPPPAAPAVSPQAAQPAIPNPSASVGADAANSTSGTLAPATGSAPIASSAASTGGIAGNTPVSNRSPAAPGPAAAAPVTSATVPDAATRLATLSDRLDKLTAAHEADQTQLQALQAGMASMQKQLAEVATVRPAGQTTPAKPVRPRAVRQGAGESGAWELRSATSDMALIGHPGRNDLKKIAPGDMVSGLGKITSIEEQDGSWVVHGTSGSLKQ